VLLLHYSLLLEYDIKRKYEFVLIFDQALYFVFTCLKKKKKIISISKTKRVKISSQFMKEMQT
jgi:hypothetical protein